jgi:hypothetical protein
MTTAKKINVPDLPAVDPPTDPPLDETLEVRARRFEVENIELRAQLDARDKADAEALARELDGNNPARNYQSIYRACCLVGLHSTSDYKKAWKWFKLKKIYGRKPDGVHVELCVNDLRDKVNKTGRHR